MAALEQAIADGDAEAAKENFHAAMMIFKEISGKEWQDRPSNVGNDGSDGLSGLLARMQAYADNLELVAKKNSVTVDFAGLDRLFARASQQVADGQSDAALKTIHEAKETIKMINKEIRGEVSEHGSKRSLAYAAKYIERLDGMIEESKERGAADQTVAQLRADLDTARETLEMIKQHVKDGKPHDAGELLRDLAKQLRSIKAALGS
ncbi:MAG: hypothetical protein EB829_01930 [Nitrosopumilus sp. H8]|nr:MAG: hypothetical protein EB829_01930 [Nitrosopumilus sp. H8]